MATYEYARGKVRVICGCGFQSKKFETEAKARQSLAGHNFHRHPGVQPRWNPSVHHEEKKRRDDEKEEGH